MENKVIKAGTKIVIGMHAGMAGTDSMEAYILERDFTEKDLEDFAWELGIDHADSYGVYPASDLDNLSEEELEEIDENDYSDNIEGWWELYDSDKHDGHVMYGNQQEVHFNKLG